MVARLSGDSWEQFVRTNIMQPLKMNHSYCSDEVPKDNNVAQPHSTEGEDGKLRQISLFKEIVNDAAGGISSNVSDMFKRVNMQLDQGKCGADPEKQLFKAARQKEMWQIRTVMDVRLNSRYNPHFNRSVLGWFLTDIKGTQQKVKL